MTREQYEASRQELMAQARTAIEAGNTEESTRLMNAVRSLDEEYRACAEARANFEALEGISQVAAATILAPEGTVELIAETETEAQAYERAFYNVLTNRPLSNEDQAVYDSVNHTGFQNAAQTEENHQMIVPETWVQQIWMQMEEQHPIIADIQRYAVPGNLTIAKDNDGTYDAEWQDENTEATEDGFVTAKVELTGCELMKCINVSWKLKKMAMNDFMNYLTSLISRKMGNALAAAYFVGKGIPVSGDSFKHQPKGIITEIESETDKNQVQTFVSSSGISYSNLVAANAKLGSGYFGQASYYARQDTIWNQLANITETSGKPIFIPDPTRENIGFLFGRPVKEEAAVPEKTVVLGAPGRGYVANTQEQITLYQEDHVKARSTDYMSYMLTDGAVIDTKAFVEIRPVVAAVPETAKFDKATTSAGYADLSFAINGGTVTAVKNGADALTVTTNYTISNGIVTIKKAYLATLAVGTVTLSFVTANGTVTAAITVVQS